MSEAFIPALAILALVCVDTTVESLERTEVGFTKNFWGGRRRLDCCDEVCYGILHRQECCSNSTLLELEENRTQYRLQLCDLVSRVNQSLEAMPAHCSNFIDDSNSSQCNLTQQLQSTTVTTSTELPVKITTTIVAPMTTFFPSSTVTTSTGSVTTSTPGNSTVTTSSSHVTTSSHSSTLRVLSTTPSMSPIGPHYTSWNTRPTSKRKQHRWRWNHSNGTVPLFNSQRRRRTMWRSWHTPPQWDR